MPRLSSHEKCLGLTLLDTDCADVSELKFSLGTISPDVVVSALDAEPSPALDGFLLDAINATHAKLDSKPLPLFIST